MVNMKTSWNLKLLYKSDSDPRIEGDLREIERAYASFEKKYKGKPFAAAPKNLAEAFEDHEALSEKVSGLKPWWYFALKTDLDSDDSASSAKATKHEQRLTEAANRSKFFLLDIAKIPVSKRRAFLEHPALEPYGYTLERIFKKAQFDLPEGEEQMEDLLSQTSYTMWVDAQQRLLNRQTIAHKGKDVPIVKAIAELSDMPKAERRSVHGKVVAALKSVSYMAEGELNAVYNYKKVMDKRRGFKKPYSATILAYQNDERAIEGFVSLVTRSFNISHRFYRLHAKLLGEKKLTLADRSAKIGEIKTAFDFPRSVTMLKSALDKVDPEYARMFDEFLENGQIDVYPQKGKKGGAYCWGMGKLRTFLLLNHVNDIRSLETLAHEMGHAIHTELSKRQPPRYQHYSTATAEVASTFFEQLMSGEVEKLLSEKEQAIMLHNRIQGDISTIFRQIACFNFENELHQKIRKDGQASKEEIAALMAKHLKSYTGAAVDVIPDDGYFFTYWSHIRRFFYVYTYAYGQLVSRALYERWKEDPAYAGKIKQFLSAGSSMSPEDIFRSIGIDTSKPAFFEAGLKSIERDIAKLEKLSGKK